MTFSIATKVGEVRDFAILPGGRLALFRGAETVRDRVRTKMATFLGDWYLDTTHGIDYDGKIFGFGATQDEASAILRAGILEVAGVIEITKFSLFVRNSASRNFGAEVEIRVESTAFDSRADTTLMTVIV